MITSSLWPTAPMISVTSSRAHGEESALMRVHSAVPPKSQACAMAMNPWRAASLASAGMPSSRLPRTTSTCAMMSLIFARTFSICGGTKWIVRSSRTGSSRSGKGAPSAIGWKKRRGCFMRCSPGSAAVSGRDLSSQAPPVRWIPSGILIMNRRDLLRTASLLGIGLAPWRALAQGGYRDRLIKLIVPFAPGGATDVVGRLWARKVEPALGTVVIENKASGGGAPGASEVARAQPDGHTLLFGNTSTQVLL